MSVSVPLSLLDLARVVPGDAGPADAIARSVRNAQLADELGYHRLWFSEHHNTRSIISSATTLMIQHVAAQTSRIRVGAGGIMLPNHSPLVVAEQFGMLEALYPGRIDLGLGRAPGTDMPTVRALRRTGREAEQFPQDDVELHGLLSDESPLAGVEAYPGTGSHVPLYILGSSMFGAQLAAQLGLPYAFASHFAPTMLREAAQTYRDRFDPTGPLAPEGATPHFIAAVNVIATDDADTARDLLRRAQVQWLKAFFGRQQSISDEQAEALLPHPQAQHVLAMLDRTVAGTQSDVVAGLEDLIAEVQADELILVNLAPDEEHQRRTLQLLAPEPSEHLASPLSVSP